MHSIGSVLTSSGACHVLPLCRGSSLMMGTFLICGDSAHVSCDGDSSDGDSGDGDSGDGDSGDGDSSDGDSSDGDSSDGDSSDDDSSDGDSSDGDSGDSTSIVQSADWLLMDSIRVFPPWNPTSRSCPQNFILVTIS